MTFRKKLFRIALISSPLIGLTSVIPMVIFISSIQSVVDLSQAPEPKKAIIALLITVLTVFFYWTFNIELFTSKKLAHKLKNYQRYIISFVGVALFVLVVTYCTEPFRSPIIKELGVLRYYPYFGSGINNVLILLILNLLIGQEEKLKLEKKAAHLNLLHLKSELELLKQQIHPHFLFNSLATLEYLIEENTEVSLEYIHKLSNFLRQSIELSKDNTISLKKDLAFMEVYVDIQKIRFEDAIKIEFQNGVKNSDHLLPVFTCQTLVENAIKHTRFEKDTPLQITISQADNFVIVSNNKKAKKEFVPSTNTGLNNLNDRSKLICNKVIIVEDEENEFRVKVPLVTT